MQRSPWTIRNDILNAWTMTVLLFAALAIAFGPVVLPFLLIQAVYGFSLLEVVNYLEHYGLLRQRREDGRYERTRPDHSWNSNNISSNVLLYHLQRHSDHHAHPMRRYQALRHFDEAPELPSGYATMILLAVIPPLWRRVMDHRVVAHYGGDLALANIHPAKRRKILSRYGGGEIQGHETQSHGTETILRTP
jgi:alkane 1-monooxygenase